MTVVQTEALPEVLDQRLTCPLPPTGSTVLTKMAPSGSPGTSRGTKKTTVTEMKMVAKKMTSRSPR